MLHSKSKSTRLISFAIAVVFMFVSILASTESVSAATKLKVTAAKKTIYVGQTVKLKANKTVKWSVSKKKIAKLTKKKKKSVTVKGLKPGTVYVKAKAGKKIKKIKITVKAKPKAAPKKTISIVSSSGIIGIGETCSVTTVESGSSVSMDDVIFSSSDASVADVYYTGLVTGISPGTATITATYKYDKSVKASVDITVVATKAGTLTLKVDLSDETRYPAGEAVRVWLPVPQSDEQQSITSVKCDAPGARLTEDSAGGKQMYIEWGADAKPEDRVATLSYHLYRKAVIRDKNIESMEKGSLDSEAAKYLGESYWSGSLTSGIVKDTADEIVDAAGAQTFYQKAFAIYDWMCNNLVRTDDKTVIFGDVESILKGYRGEDGGRNAGSCMDMNSVFVALCRAEGIPARTKYGFRFTTLGPNCRAEFYLPGYGWVPADPALAIKQGRGLDSPAKLDHDVTWEKIKDKYWGNAEENWICVNMGRDIVLDPPQSIVTDEYLEVLNPAEDGISTINLFMFPYGEYGDQYIPCQNSKNFKYEYSFEEENPLDCGC